MPASATQPLLSLQRQEDSHEELSARLLQPRPGSGGIIESACMSLPGQHHKMLTACLLLSLLLFCSPNAAQLLLILPDCTSVLGASAA